MNESERILVIILAGTLALFLVLIIIATIKVIQILNHIKSITEKAENIADKAEAVGDFFQKAAGPVAIGRLITNIAENVFQTRSSKRKSKGEHNEE